MQCLVKQDLQLGEKYVADFIHVYLVNLCASILLIVVIALSKESVIKDNESAQYSS